MPGTARERPTVATLFAKTHDRALTITEIAAAAFDLGDGEAPSRVGPRSESD